MLKVVCVLLVSSMLSACHLSGYRRTYMLHVEDGAGRRAGIGVAIEPLTKSGK